MELSDDSDIEVHPNVDKRSFIRAKQNQIHIERRQRKFQIEGLNYEHVVNNNLLRRVSDLLQSLEAAGPEAHSRNPIKVTFKMNMALAMRNPDDDNPPARPEGVFESEQPLPAYSKMIAGLLDKANKTLDERGTPAAERFDSFVREIDVHRQKIRDLIAQSNNKLEELMKAGGTKITSESYHIGFDSSHVNKESVGESGSTQLELLNPNYDTGKIDGGSSANDSEDPTGGSARAEASPDAKKFAEIKASNYQASRDFISSHPGILQESNIDGLLVEAFNIGLEQEDDARTWQYVHQAMLLQWCRMLGRDGVTVFFKGMASPGHRAQEAFTKDVDERFQRIRQPAKENAKQRVTKDADVEQIQIHAIDKDTTIEIRVPRPDTEDDDEKRARAIFEQFTPDMRAALETGSLNEVNKVLGKMIVKDAEDVVALLSNVSYSQIRSFPGLTTVPLMHRCALSFNEKAGCLSIEHDIIDTTTEEGKEQLTYIEQVADSESHIPISI